MDIDGDVTRSLVQDHAHQQMMLFETWGGQGYFLKELQLTYHYTHVMTLLSNIILI